MTSAGTERPGLREAGVAAVILRVSIPPRPSGRTGQPADNRPNLGHHDGLSYYLGRFAWQIRYADWRYRKRRPACVPFDLPWRGTLRRLSAPLAQGLDFAVNRFR